MKKTVAELQTLNDEDLAELLISTRIIIIDTDDNPVAISIPWQQYEELRSTPYVPVTAITQSLRSMRLQRADDAPFIQALNYITQVLARDAALAWLPHNATPDEHADFIQQFRKDVNSDD